MRKWIYSCILLCYGLIILGQKNENLYVEMESVDVIDSIDFVTDLYTDIPIHYVKDCEKLGDFYNNRASSSKQRMHYSIDVPFVPEETYLLRLNENQTRDFIILELLDSLKNYKNYLFGFLISSDLNDTRPNFDKAVLRIWDYIDECNYTPLFESSEVDNKIWKEYIITLQPRLKTNKLKIEIFYNTPSIRTYNSEIDLSCISKLYQLK